MANSQMSEVIQHLRSAVLLRDVAGLTDGQLLRDYLRRRDEAALAALVRRHGPMVWGVCHRVLRNFHDAEDAFQATFLVLVRKAASLASPELLANWLYGVAHQTALKARATTTKRMARERQLTEMPAPAVMEQDLWNDLQPLLDQELGSLPDKYRVAIVLCDLEGKTRREAARQLGVPEGTLAARLARGRVLLAKRLGRHGLAIAGGALAVVLSANVASAGAPTSVVSSVIKAASLFAAGQGAAAGVISAQVAALAEGVLKTMLLTKLKIALAVLWVVAALSGAAGLIYQTQAAEQKRPQGVTERDNEKQPSDKKDEKPKTDEDRLQGTWEFFSMTAGAPTLRKDQLAEAETPWKTITFTGDKMQMVNRKLGEPDAGKDLVFDDRFKLDPSQKPKAIDLVVDDDRPGRQKGETVACVYELDGDLLRLCFPSDPKERPSALESPVGSGNLILTFKRVVKK
jgi:RNA polymerase sigma factor (sigma-70 family)